MSAPTSLLGRASLAGALGLTVAVTVSIGACDGDDCAPSYRDRGTPQDVCLGAQTSSAAEAPACYVPPQVCPNLQPVGFCSRLVGAEPQAFNLLLQNLGREELVITGVKVRGDGRCAFTKPQLDPAFGQPIKAADGQIVRFKYQPPRAGEDHVMLEFTTNAENFPVLKVAACGRGVTSTTAPEALRCLPCEDKSEAEYTDCWE